MLVDTAPRRDARARPRPVPRRRRVLRARRRDADRRVGGRGDGRAVSGSATAAAPHRSLIWCVGRAADPMVERLGPPSSTAGSSWTRTSPCPAIRRSGVRRRRRRARPHPARRRSPPMTAQHATAAGRAGRRQHRRRRSGTAPRRPYKHQDLGFVVDLGGWQAAAESASASRCPGSPAKAVTRGYHLLSLPGNRGRIATDWSTEAMLPRQVVQLGLVHSGRGPAEHRPAAA